MRDAEVRALLLSRLREWHSDEPDTRIVDELALCNGSARIDVAVLNGRLTGWEIKSPRDRLDRLAGQVTYYSQVCDEAWLLTDESHLEAARKLVPKWWGLMLLTELDGQPELQIKRKAVSNPKVDVRAVVRLLWREEALTALVTAGVDLQGLARAPRAQLWAELVQRVDPIELRAMVRETLKARERWRQQPPARRPRRGRVAWQVVATVEPAP